MISAQDVKRVQARFSHASDRYERLAFIQGDIRRDLLRRLDALQGKCVLDVGCGTGALLTDLFEKDPCGCYVGVDLAWGMVYEAHTADAAAHVVQADAVRLPFKKESFDLAVSSSSYQWMSDLPAAFAAVRRTLKEGGCFEAALFGQATLHEFWESLGHARAGSKSILSQLPAEERVRRALMEAGFSDVTVLCERRETLFRDLWSLLMWLKSIGANHLGQEIFLGREMLGRAQTYYQQKYGQDDGIRATFEVIWIDAKK